MRGLPESVLEEARKVAECLQDREAVELRHGYWVDQADGILVVEKPDSDDRERQGQTVQRASHFSFWVDGIQYWVPYTAGRRIVATSKYADFEQHGENASLDPYRSFPDVRWEYLDPE